MGKGNRWVSVLYQKASGKGSIKLREQLSFTLMLKHAQATA